MRTNFSSSKLVRLLAEPSTPGAAGTRVDSAEQLSTLLGVFDAVTLRGALHAIQAMRVATPPATKSADPGRGVGLAEQLRQLRLVLVHAITVQPVAVADAGASRRRGRSPAPLSVPAAPEAAAVDYALYRQRHLDLQRTMELMVTPLRARVREALAAVSPALRQLAALDGVWEQLLAAREQKALATIPTLLKSRFEQLRALQPRAWLDTFGQEQQAVLLAELDLRLEPVTGLVEAFQRETAVAQGPAQALRTDSENLENTV